jgi:hypothetical protein
VSGGSESGKGLYWSERKSCPVHSAKAWNGASMSGVVSGTSTLGLGHNDQMGFVKQLKCEFKYTVKYHARLKSDQSPMGSNGVRQKGLGSTCKKLHPSDHFGVLTSRQRLR